MNSFQPLKVKRFMLSHAGGRTKVAMIRTTPAALLLLLVNATVTPSFAGPTAIISSVNQTQAILQEQGFSGACSLQLSTSPSFKPLHADVDPGKYPNADTDTGRADTVLAKNGAVRLVTLGHINDDRALAAYTTYYYRVSGCGGTATGSFMTATLSHGTTRSEQSPFNSSKWGNLGLPAFDWTTSRTYVDPLTGAQLFPMPTSFWSWRTGCSASGCNSSSRPFADWAGGEGWNNPSGVLLGASTSASTGDTNPVDLYADLSAGADPLPYDWHRTLEDVGLVVWGSGSSSNPADRIVNLCIFLNPTAGCASKTIQVTLPAGSVAHVSSGSSDLDGAFPSAFPSSPFHGWTGSASPLIRMENRETFGTLSVAGNTLSIGNLSSYQHFSSTLGAGQKIFIAGSACPNSFCTLSAAPGGPGAATVQETPMVTGANFRSYGWGIRVWKDNPEGTIKFGAQFKLAGSHNPIATQPGGDRCSRIQVTSGDGKKGYLCSLTSATPGYGFLAFIATDGTTRILSLAGADSIPNGFSFDDTQGNVVYAGGHNTSGGWTVYKYSYTGNYTTQLDYHYTCGPGGDCPAVDTGFSAPVDLMPHALNADLDQQIEARQNHTLPAYNSAMYGPWTVANGAVAYYGSSGHFGFFCNVYSGQGQPSSGGPGWCASVDLSQNPAQVVRVIHTLDGTGAASARFGSLHSAQQVDSNPDTLFMSLDGLYANNTATLHGGPYQATVQSILGADGVTWNTNTCLDWPPKTGSGFCGTEDYYGACPAGSAPYTACVTFRLPQNGVCNVAPTPLEKSTWPCPWNSSYSQYPLMQAGDNSTDTAGNPYATDGEHFHILSVKPDTENSLRVVAARNGTYDYCSISPWHGQVNTLSAQSVSQLQHASGWTLTMMPGSVNSCGASALLQDQLSGTVEELGHGLVGHFAIGAGSFDIQTPRQTPKLQRNRRMNFVTSSAAIYDTPFSLLAKIPPVYNSTSPAFHGSPAQIGWHLQSYTDDGQSDAGSTGTSWALDMNPLTPCGEALGCGLIRTTIRVAGNVYRVETIGSASQTNSTYKSQPMIGWAGRYQLQDVSGPSANIDNTPYSMCFVINPGECHAGSAANEVYVNVPVAFDPGYCTGGLSFINDPCVLFGDNAPAGGIRQFSIARNDPDGSYSRFISNGWSSAGRHYPFSHAVAYPDGRWVMVMGTNAIDGYSMTGLMVSLPPLPAGGQHDNEFRQTAINVPSGYSYAEVQFGYSRYIGTQRSPAGGLYCTSRADSCNTSSSSLFNFESETRTLKNCKGGCTVKIPEVGPNVIYYRTRQSSDGKTWINSDLVAIAIQ